MSPRIYAEIQKEQDAGRKKYGGSVDNLSHDDFHTTEEWHQMIEDHNDRAASSTPMDRRQHLIKVAGLAISAAEAIDRWSAHQG